MCVGIEVALGIMSAGIGAVGAMQQADAAAASADYNAQVQANNAIIARDNAADARRRGVVEEQANQRKTKQTLGTQRAVMASRYVDMGSGSSLEILGDTAMFGKLDSLKIRDAHIREERSHRTQAMNFDAQSELSRMEADSHRQAGPIAALGKVTGGFANIRGMRIN